MLPEKFEAPIQQNAQSLNKKEKEKQLRKKKKSLFWKLNLRDIKVKVMG